jgi:hypothetical protein
MIIGPTEVTVRSRDPEVLEFVDQDVLVDRAETEAAVLDRPVQPPPALLADLLLERIQRAAAVLEAALGLLAQQLRGDVLAEKGPDLIPPGSLVRVEFEIHDDALQSGNGLSDRVSHLQLIDDHVTTVLRGRQGPRLVLGPPAFAVTASGQRCLSVQRAAVRRVRLCAGFHILKTLRSRCPLPAGPVAVRVSGRSETARYHESLLAYRPVTVLR